MMAQLIQHPTVKRFYERTGVLAGAAEPSTLDAGWLRTLCLEAGADEVGFVGIDRPEIADQRDDILAVFPRTKTLASFVCRMNREPVRSPARSVANLEFYHRGYCWPSASASHSSSFVAR